jgi:hypothetical protein
VAIAARLSTGVRKRSQVSYPKLALSRKNDSLLGLPRKKAVHFQLWLANGLTVCDCKDYKNPVDIKVVEAFIAMIKDLGRPKVPLFSTSGFTGGAIPRAKDARIDTYGLVATRTHPWAKLLSIPALAPITS